MGVAAALHLMKWATILKWAALAFWLVLAIGGAFVLVAAYQIGKELEEMEL